MAIKSINNIKIFIIFIGILSSSFPVSSKILENNDSIKFTEERDNTDIKGYALRFTEFRKFKQSNEDQFQKKNSTPYTIEGDRGYMSLIPFIEVLQFSDFQVAPNKDYAIVYSASCQRKLASAESPFKCKLHAATLNQEGFIRGDMEGDFKKVLFHKTEPYVFLIKDSAGDSTIYAEVYDMKGNRVRKVKSFNDGMLINPVI